MPNNNTIQQDTTPQTTKLQQFKDFCESTRELRSIVGELKNMKGQYWTEAEGYKHFQLAHLGGTDGSSRPTTPKGNQIITLKSSHVFKILRTVATLGNVPYSLLALDEDPYFVEKFGDQFNTDDCSLYDIKKYLKRWMGEDDVKGFIGSEGRNDRTPRRFWDSVVILQFPDISVPIEYQDESWLMDLTTSNQSNHFFSLDEDNSWYQKTGSLFFTLCNDPCGLILTENNLVCLDECSYPHDSMWWDKLIEDKPLTSPSQIEDTINTILTHCMWDFEYDRGAEAIMKLMSSRDQNLMYLLTIEACSTGPNGDGSTSNSQELHTSLDSALESVKEQFNLDSAELLLQCSHSDGMTLFQNSELSFYISPMTPRG